MTWTQNFRTSPVKRGVWVLENILGTPPPEPPPNVPALEDTAAGSKKVLTLREQMTLHRATPTCAGCHKIMDPIGFALDNFDADGKWRAKQGGEGGTPIDAAVELYDGQKVNGPVGLRQALMRYSPQFVRDDGREDDDLRVWAAAWNTPTCRRSARSCATRRRTTTASRRSSSGVVKSPQFQMRVKAARARDQPRN